MEKLDYFVIGDRHFLPVFTRYLRAHLKNIFHFIHRKPVYEPLFGSLPPKLEPLKCLLGTRSPLKVFYFCSVSQTFVQLSSTMGRHESRVPCSMFDNFYHPPRFAPGGHLWIAFDSILTVKSSQTHCLSYCQEFFPKIFSRCALRACLESIVCVIFSR